MNLQSTLFRFIVALCMVVGCNDTFAQPKPKDFSKKLGMKINDAQYLQMPKKAQNVVFRGILPTTKTLTQFCPAIEDQGEYGTCVGWATAYYMRTIIEARKRNLTSANSIAPFRFSPTYIYEQIKKSSDYDCQGGATIPDALQVMRNKGAALLACQPYQCGANVSKCDADAANYKIENFATLFDILQTPSEVKVLKIKEALAVGDVPVPIGMMVPRSFFSATDQWQAAPGEEPENALGGHAMAIIGYDDNRYGGSFLIANSWGTQWGNNGFTWAKYEDVARFTRYAFQVFMPVNPNPPINTTTLKSDMVFKLSDNNADIPVTSIQERGLDVTKDPATVEMITYRMTTPYNSGTRFKMSINNSKQSYVYIVGSDDVNRVTKLFPYQGDLSQNVSAIVSPNTSVMLPAADRSFTLDTVTGNDFFLVLVSEKELNVEEVAAKIKNASGSFAQKVYSAFGSELISPVNIAYQPTQVSFEVKGNPTGTIVPMLVRIVHK